MSTTHDYQTRRARALGLALATGLMVAACGGSSDDPSDTEDAGGGNNDAGRNDGGMGNDAGTGDSGAPIDSGPGNVDGREDSGISDPAVDGSMPPSITAQNGVAFFDDDAGGPRILLRGRDPNGDVKEAVIEFFKKDDAGTATPVAIDFSPDDDDPAQSSFTVPVTPVPLEAGFFVQLEQTSVFTELVDTVKVTVKDSGGRASDPITVSKTKAPAATGACDPYGFNLCASTNVCAATSTGFSCQGLPTARGGLASRILALTPPSVTKVLGTLRLTSFWDPPSGCAPDGAKRRPDAVIKLRLTADASKVTLSTDNPGTNITDTVLYALTTSLTSEPGTCNESSCLCNDDIQGGTPTRRSKLELPNVKKDTDYYVVVDSVQAPATEPGGRDFEVSVTVE